ncbi:hypothetical protein NDU88_006510 [Pleurodeles waltl]|uniref:Uncharacterized protein n=1 Tax=Pleurodeles waltl TaxID=8319 RepID=A0AAV7UL79_PLEWA|nr:hypothetical protein NDU88_006510 [Pleurodeles waltl]
MPHRVELRSPPTHGASGGGKPEYQQHLPSGWGQNWRDPAIWSPRESGLGTSAHSVECRPPEAVKGAPASLER